MADHPPDGGTTRLERDSFGDIRVPAARLWGAQTQRSLQHRGRQLGRSHLACVDPSRSGAMGWCFELLVPGACL